MRGLAGLVIAGILLAAPAAADSQIAQMGTVEASNDSVSLREYIDQRFKSIEDRQDRAFKVTEDRLKDAISNQENRLTELAAERAKLIEQRFSANTEAIQAAKQATDAALVAARQALAAALEAANAAVGKAEDSSNKRFDSVNEFRKTLTDQQLTFATIAVVDARFKSLEEKIDAAMARLNSIKSQGEGASGLWEILVGVLGVAALIVGVYLSVVGARK